MRVRWLGWAGVEIEADGAGLVIDPLADPGATFAALGEEALRRVKLPAVVPPETHDAVAGLVTHLHRDHTDASALGDALAPDAAVHEPVWPGGEDAENVALAQANAELERAGLRRRRVEIWEGAEAGPFAITALPAVDGLGDPRSPGWSRRTGSASSTSGTRSSTATGGEWPAATGPSTWCSRLSMAPV